MRIEEYRGRNGRGTQVHRIYEPEEARSAGIEFLDDWRRADRRGQWVLTEDGFVVEVLNLGHKGGRLAWLRTCTGSFTVGQRLDTAPRECRWTFSGRHPGARKNRRNLIFADLVASGVNLETAYLQTHPRAKPGQRAHYRAMALFKSEVVQQAVSEKLDDILKALKIDKRFVLERYRELAQDADKDAVRLGALKELGRLVGLDDKKTISGGLIAGVTFGDMAQVGAAVVSKALPATAEAEVVEEGEEVSQIEDFVDE